MKKLVVCVASLMALLGFSACDDTTDANTIPGGALVSDQISMVIDSSFTITTRSIVNDRIQSRTTTQLLGAISAPEYGILKADYVAQLFPSNAIDTTDMSAQQVDSIKLQMVFEKDGFVGDSLAPIGVEVYALNRRLPYPIYSDFNPAGYFSTTDRMGTGVFTATGVGVNDTVAASSYRYAYVTLPLEFGRKLYDKFIESPQLFNDPEAFADWFPGIYVHHVYGSGRVTRISESRVIMYYHKVRDLTNSSGEVVKDSLTRHYAYYMGSAPEVVSNTEIDLTISPDVNSMVQQGRSIVVSPAGLDAELEFPTLDVMQTYRAQSADALSVINNLSFTLPVDSIRNGRGITPPPYLLMVLSDEKDEFFADNKLPDDITSFLGTYSSATNTYTFSDMRAYLLEMLNKDTIEAKDYTFTLTPVAMVTESAGSYYGSVSTPTLSGITPMVALPSMVELFPADAKITLTFSKQILK